MTTLLLRSAAAFLPLVASSAYAQDEAPPAKPPTDETADHWFRNVTDSAGVTWTHEADRDGKFRFPEIMGGGVALFDYDGDGDLDLYLVQGGVLGTPDEGEVELGNALYRNDSADGSMKFVDVTEEAGVGDTGYGMGAACGDFDRDGDVDLFVTNVGPNVLYRNNGDGTFTDATEKLKVGHPGWGTSAAFFDANGDDKLDLYVVNNLGWSESIETPCVNYYQERDYCAPTNYNAPAADLLYTFGRLGYSDSTVRAGIEAAFGNGLGLTIGDYDADGDLDVYVANDATKNVLWQNDGRGRFKNVAKLGGCAVNGSGKPEAGMGVQFADVDDDGDLDLYMTHLRRETNTYYRNRKGRFSDVSNIVGTNGASLLVTGFGMGIQDFDQDGTIDLFVANGAVQSWKAHERFNPGRRLRRAESRLWRNAHQARCEVRDRERRGCDPQSDHRNEPWLGLRRPRRRRGHRRGRREPGRPRRSSRERRAGCGGCELDRVPCRRRKERFRLTRRDRVDRSRRRGPAVPPSQPGVQLPVQQRSEGPFRSR